MCEEVVLSLGYDPFLSFIRGLENLLLLLAKRNQLARLWVLLNKSLAKIRKEGALPFPFASCPCCGLLLLLRYLFHNVFDLGFWYFSMERIQNCFKCFQYCAQLLIILCSFLNNANFLGF